MNVDVQFSNDIMQDVYFQEEEPFQVGMYGAVLVHGKDGKSAYQLALENGFSGTESEWLASLKGKDGSNGKDGKNGTNGKDGYTPRKGVDYFDGEKGEKGDRGLQGIQGVQGKQGIQGEKGEKGETPVKGVDYFTDAERAEMVQSVLSLLPVYNGEVVSV